MEMKPLFLFFLLRLAFADTAPCQLQLVASSPCTIYIRRKYKLAKKFQLFDKYIYSWREPEEEEEEERHGRRLLLLLRKTFSIESAHGKCKTFFALLPSSLSFCFLKEGRLFPLPFLPSSTLHVQRYREREDRQRTRSLIRPSVRFCSLKSGKRRERVKAHEKKKKDVGRTRQ